MKLKGIELKFNYITQGESKFIKNKNNATFKMIEKGAKIIDRGYSNASNGGIIPQVLMDPSLPIFGLGKKN